MNLKRLKLVNFRSYENSEFVFSEGINVIYGQNATGKTNILEAIYLLSLGESFRARKIDEMVRFENEWGRISGEVEDGRGVKKLSIMITKGEINGKRVAKRKFMVDEAS